MDFISHTRRMFIHFARSVRINIFFLFPSQEFNKMMRRERVVVEHDMLICLSLSTIKVLLYKQGLSLRRRTTGVCGYNGIVRSTHIAFPPFRSIIHNLNKVY